MALEREAALIVAAGSGSRMGGNLPKQLQLLHGIPLAIYPGLQFRSYQADLPLVYAIQPGTVPVWEPLMHTYFPEGNWQLVEGGASRYLSVKQGINALEDTIKWLAIHDGARPFIQVKTIALAFATAQRLGSAVASVPVKDSLRRVSGDGSEAIDRTRYYLVQTPQIFRLADLKKAYQIPDSERFTDDATVMEIQGHTIHLVDGAYENIKITSPEDWEMASLLFPKIYPTL